jgi:cysteine-rich repeat protein
MMTHPTAQPCRARGIAWLAAAAFVVCIGRTDARAGGLAFVDRLEGGIGTTGGLNGVRALAVTPDGFQVYAASEKAGSLSLLQRDDLTGMLLFSGRAADGEAGVDGLDHVRGVAVSPDGGNVYAVGDRDDALAVFARDPLSGALTFLQVLRDGVDGVDGLDGARGVVVSPDGLHVYTAAGNDDAVAVFGRDAASGTLAFVEVQRDGVGGVHGMKGAESLVMSADGLTLYVAAPGDDAVAVFMRDLETGALTFVERQRDETDGVDGLDGVRSLALSPDGLNLYAGGKLDDAIAVFACDPGTGALTFVERLRDNADGVDGLDGVEALAVSVDGGTVYAVSSADDAVAVFERNLDDGTLRYLYAQRDGQGPVTGLSGPKGVVLAGDHVYVAAADSDSILAFSSRCGDGFLDPSEQCDDGNAADGDGCSPTCRLSCATAADCDDGDACTDDACRLGECASAHCGSAGAVCELSRALPAFQTSEACGPLDRTLARLVRQKLREARHDVVRLRHRRGAAEAKLMASLDRALRSVHRKAVKLAAAGAITPDCAASLQHAVDELTAELHQALLRHGVCAG